MNFKNILLVLCLVLGVARAEVSEIPSVSSVFNEGLAEHVFSSEITNDEINFFPGQNYETVAFKNKCHKPIAIFVHYLRLNNTWITKGYYKLNPNQMAQIFNTRNTIFYYYAQSMDGTIVWKGQYDFIYKNVVIPMRMVQMDISRWGVYTMYLTCD